MLRRAQELEEIPRRVGLARRGMHAAGEDGGLRYCRRQRADELDAGEVDQLAHLLEADLDLALGDELANIRARRRRAKARLDLVEHAHALEEARQIDPTRPGR